MLKDEAKKSVQTTAGALSEARFWSAAHAGYGDEEIARHRRRRSLRRRQPIPG